MAIFAATHAGAWYANDFLFDAQAPPAIGGELQTIMASHRSIFCGRKAAMRNSILLFLSSLCVGCAPHLIGPADQNSALVIGRVSINSKFGGNFYGALPQGVVEKGVAVEIESRDGKETLNVTTGDNGYFLVPNIAQKNYFVRKVIIEGMRNNQREYSSWNVQRLNFAPLPGRVLYIGSLFIDLSERGTATYREAREGDVAKAYFNQSFGGSPWSSRTFVALGASPIAQVTDTVAPQKSEGAAPTYNRPEWKAGYEWRYSWKEPAGSGTLTREVVREESFDGVPTYVVKTGKSETFYAKDVLGAIATTTAGRVTLKRDAPYQPLSWPLYVGKEWKNSYLSERPLEKSSERFDLRMAVSQLETVQVKAGNFEAFKIEVFNAYSGVLLTEFWYSPQVKWFVKSRAYNQTGVRDEELISYKIN